MTSRSFERLEKRIEREYIGKGKSRARAEYIAKATAGRIARIRRERG